MNTINNQLQALGACEDAQEWAKGKTWEDIFTACHRGDWLLWLFRKTNPDDLQLLTLAKGHVANTVRHLMKDERSIKAVDAAIAFGEGKITRDELNAAADAAADAYAAAYAAAAADADADAYAAAYAAADAYAAAYAAADAYAYAAAAAADAALLLLLLMPVRRLVKKTKCSQQIFAGSIYLLRFGTLNLIN